MKPFTRKELIILIGGITLLLMVAALITFGRLLPKKTEIKSLNASSFNLPRFFQTKNEADIKKAKDLSSLSGLSKEKILKLYNSTNDWEGVQKNIFVYRKILSLINEESPDYNEVFNVISKYKAKDILIIYEFLAANSSNFKQAEGLLKKHEKGSSMESLLTGVLESRQYKFYNPANKTMVRDWLKVGYSPEDILAADNIARAKDLKIEKVLSLKNKTSSWQEVGRKLSYEFPKNSQKAVTLSFRGTAGNKSFSGKNYETIVKEANNKAEQEKNALEEKIACDLGLTNIQIAEYKKQGFSIWDIHNASLLSKKTSNSLDQILAERKDGHNWEQIVENYSD